MFTGLELRESQNEIKTLNLNLLNQIYVYYFDQLISSFKARAVTDELLPCDPTQDSHNS